MLPENETKGEVADTDNAPDSDDEFNAGFDLATTDEDSAQPKGPAATDGEGDDKAPDDSSAQTGDTVSVDDAPDGDNTPQADNPSNNDDDPWANAPPELRELHEKQLRDADLRHRSEQGRTQALRGQLAELQRRVEQQQQSGAEPTEQQKQDNEDKAKAISDKFEQLREDYPEVAGPLLDEIESLRGQMETVAKGHGEIASERVARQEAQQWQVLEQAHPDFRQVFNDDRFAGWLQDQPHSVQEAYRRNIDSLVDGQDAAFVVERFKTEVGFGQQKDPPPKSDAELKRERQLASGKDGGRTGHPVKHGVPDDAEQSANYWAEKV